MTGVSVHDDKISERPLFVSETVVKNASSVFSSDRRRSLDVITKSVGVSHGTAFNIVSQDLHIRACGKYFKKQ